jgi:hypothetical protein
LSSTVTVTFLEHPPTSGVEVFSKLIRICPVRWGDGFIKAVLVDTAVSYFIDIIGDMGVAITVWRLADRILVCH